MGFSKVVKVSDDIAELNIDVIDMLLPKKSTVKTSHYVDNEKFSEELLKYSKEYKQALADGTELPRMSEYIGACIQDIAHNKTRARNFYQYTYKEEMARHAIVNLLPYVHNFHSDAHTRGGKMNAYGYINSCIERLFIKYMEIERQEEYLKNCALFNMDIDSIMADSDSTLSTGLSRKMIDDAVNRASEYAANRSQKEKRIRSRRINNDIKKKTGDNSLVGMFLVKEPQE